MAKRSIGDCCLKDLPEEGKRCLAEFNVRSKRLGMSSTEKKLAPEMEAFL
jgi:hypothetical protein